MNTKALTEQEGPNDCWDFLDPIQKRALSRSVQLEAVYLKVLLYKSSFIPTSWYACMPHKSSTINSIIEIKS